MTALAWRKPSILPGFPLAFGYTLAYLSLIVLIPLAALGARAAGLGFGGLWAIATDPRVASALKLSFGTALYAPNGWIGQFTEAIGLKVAYTPIGITIALVFVGLPFIVRTVQPVLHDLEREIEEASATLGATRVQTIARVLAPYVLPAILTGFTLAFARGVGEYGSVIFIAGNMPFVSEIAPLLIVIRLEEFNYAGATGIAAIMLVISFLLLLVINALQAWTRRRTGHG